VVGWREVDQRGSSLWVKIGTLRLFYQG